MSLAKRNLVSASIAFIGIGEGGCNLANQFAKLGYTVFFINSSMKDLKKINPSKNMMFHVPLATGTNRDRDMAKQYAKENYDILCDIVEKRLGGFRNIFVCYSMGGGTGSGMSPILINGFIKRMNDTRFGSMAIIPDELSSPKMKFNASQCYAELKQIKGLGNSYFINNNNTVKNGVHAIPVTELDASFATKFNQVVRLSSVDGSVDEEEVLAMLDITGNTLIADVLPQEALVSERIIVDLSMSEVDRGCVYMAFSVDKADLPTIKALAQKKFGNYEDKYEAVGNSSFIASFGMAYPDEIMYSLYAEYREEMQGINEQVSANKFDFGLMEEFASTRSRRFTIDTNSMNAKEILEDLECY